LIPQLLKVGSRRAHASVRDFDGRQPAKNRHHIRSLLYLKSHYP
jgi:hypothetical protein